MSTARQTTHSIRNAHKDVQETRGSKRTGPLSDAEKATRALANEARQKTKAALNADIDDFFAHRDETIHDLALKHGKKEDFDAVIHELSEKSKAAGHNFKLPELQKRADAFLLAGVSEEEKARLIATLIEHRKLSTKGLRATNVGSAVDSRCVASNIQDEFLNLYERTGIRAFAFFSCGSLDDAFLLTFAGSGDAAAFCVEVLKMPAVDILRLFETWSLTREKNLPQRDDTRSVRKQITAAMDAGLRELTGNDTARMSYKHFKVDVSLAWKVKLVGWPEKVTFQNPSRINNVEVLRRLRDDLRAGLIYWEALTLDEARSVHAEVEAIRAANNGQAEPRRPRADIGGKHISVGCRENNDGNSEDDSDHDDYHLIWASFCKTYSG
ncbi:hypothetical protein C8F04DRAFT_1274883 [Mycena alexandri]|uniref:Uncharacterized protein n=1 Tax=Mycena alexandri TaxID=1745969 RepID=A0AAD6S3U7_9AGAR|nr:hypothetical protein C8F04DRAFT_1274883 [Mycena alexandri]